MRPRSQLVLITAIVVALVGSGADASVAAKRGARTGTRTYVAPAPLHGVAQATTLCATHRIGCVAFPTRESDSYVRVRVSDSSETGPVLVSMFQDLDGDGIVTFRREYLGSFCGKMNGRAKIPSPGADVFVFVYESQFGLMALWPVILPWVGFGCRTGAVATTGTVTATFSR